MAKTGIAASRFFRINNLILKSSGKEYPISGIQMTWSIDRPTTCSFVPVVGKRLLPAGGQLANIPTINTLPGNEQVTVEIDTSYNQNPVNLHIGYPVAQSVASASGSTMNSSMVTKSIQLNSFLSLLGTINPATRLFFKGVAGPSSRKSASNVTLVHNDGSMHSFFYKNQKLTDPVPPRYILDLLARLQEEHTAAGDAEPTYKIADLLETSDTYTLNDKITANGKSDITLLLATKYCDRVVSNWFNATAYQALMDFNRLAFLHTVPSVPSDPHSGKFWLAPTLPLYKETSLTLTEPQILSITKAKDSTDELEPITQIWVGRVIGGADDKNIKPVPGQISSIFYHQWPRLTKTPKEPLKGNALIKPPPELFNAICQQKLVLGGTGPKKKNTNQKGKKVKDTKNLVQDKEETDYAMTQADIDTLGEQVAKLYYVERAFNKRSVDISIPWNFYEDAVKYIGHNVSFTIPYDKEVSGGQFDTGKYIGHLVLVSLRLDRASNTAKCSVRLTHVRTEEENDEMGFDDHPFYNDWLGKKSLNINELTATILGSGIPGDNLPITGTFT